MRSRILITFFALLIVWWVIQIPAIFDPLMLFLTLGVNPFTNRELSPEAMIGLLGTVLLLSVVLIFRKELRRGLQRLGRGKKEVTPEVLPPSLVTQPATTTATLELAAPADAPNYVVDYDPAQGATVAKTGLQPLPTLQAAQAQTANVKPRRIKSAKLSFRSLPLNRMIHSFRRQGGALYSAAGAAGDTAYQWWKKTGVPGLRLAIRRTALHIALAGRRAVGALQRAWRYCEPYCRRFDKWLEGKMHKHETTAALVSLGREMETVLRRAIATVRSWRYHPVVLELLRSLRK